jgi:hypothetical protein
MSILGLWTYDNTIFNDMVVPAGVNKTELVDALLYDLAELEILYPDPIFMKHAIAAWSKKELTVWERVARAAAADYDPISNYDRIEHWEDKSSSSSGGSQTDTVVGYNASTQQPASGSTTTASGSGSGTHDGRIHGNIGVTTSQQMLEQELELAPKLCIDDYIINSFKRRFCLVVY